LPIRVEGDLQTARAAPINTGVRPPRTRVVLSIAVLGLAIGLVAPGAAAARGCSRGHDHPIHGLTVFGGVGSVVAHRLARRFDERSDFSGQASRRFIHQRDGEGRRWRCQWNNVGDDSDVVNWNCGRRPNGLISWNWHARRHRG
jgi:hypothetical protein